VIEEAIDVKMVHRTILKCFQQCMVEGAKIFHLSPGGSGISIGRRDFFGNSRSKIQLSRKNRGRNNAYFFRALSYFDNSTINELQPRRFLHDIQKSAPPVGVAGRWTWLACTAT